MPGNVISLQFLTGYRSFVMTIDIFRSYIEHSRSLYWLLALMRAYQGDVVAFGCLILLIADKHCHSKFVCRFWSVALVSAMLGDTPSAFRVAALCFALWKPLLAPNKKDNAKLHEEFALSLIHI